MTGPNAELAYRVLDTALAVKRLDMGNWSSSGDKPVGLDELTAETCGTTACMAGWTVALSGMKVNTAGRVYDLSGNEVGYVKDLATNLLGLTIDEADDLFYSEDCQVEEIVAEIFGPRPGGES